jgi:fructose-bisphosphate aldolase class II
MRSLLKDAQNGGWAVGAFSVANMECVRGVVNAAEELRAPIILQIAEVRRGHSPLAVMGPLMLAAEKRATVPVAVHLYHGKTIPCIQEALSLGFTSVMCDGSELPIEENIKLTEEVVSLASKYDAAVEAEVGRVGRGEDGSEAEAQIASLDDCFRMDKTGIDALAVGIGNAHGLYAAAPHLRYDVLEKLNGRLRRPWCCTAARACRTNSFKRSFPWACGKSTSQRTFSWPRRPRARAAPFTATSFLPWTRFHRL